MDKDKIVGEFLNKSEVASMEPFGSGHINDTFRIKNKDLDGNDYLLQRINHEIFTDVPALMKNMEAVAHHLREKINSSTLYSFTSKTLTIVPTVNGNLFFKDSGGNYWRMLQFLKGYISYDFVETPEQAYQGAAAFGQFMMLLDDFPMNKVVNTIPDFHNIIKRLDTFKNATQNGLTDRIKECHEDIAYVFDIADQMCVIEHLKIQGQVRSRVTHNDTKFNNVLLTPDHKKSCVIDLDTVMPGIVHYDFGDGVRTAAGTAIEDEADLTKVDLDMDKFNAFTAGYLERTRDVLEPVELKYLALSAPLLSYMMGVRFLTDYLSGDHYYKIDFEEHNLQRAKCQLEFTRKMILKLGDMENTVSNYLVSA